MDEKILNKYTTWLDKATEDTDLTKELKSIEGNEAEIYERFYRELEFGTGGLRGIIGAGDNRMNIYTVRKATQGLADYLKSRYKSAAVAISFDSRIKSDVFAREAARVLAGNGIKVHIFSSLQPTPVLSYAVRQLGCESGIMVTASHNPSKYNGYKCYGADGCQMTNTDAGQVTTFIRKVDMFKDVKIADFDDSLKSELITYIPDSLTESFYNAVLSQQANPGICNKSPLSVIYTPLNGTGNKPVREILRRIGVNRVTVVPEQELPDGNFPTAPYPNPEIRQAFECAIKLAQTQDADLLLATDPDCDRVGIAIADGDDYRLVSGNEVGCLLLEYILSCKKAAGKLPENPVVVTTIVSSQLATLIAQKYGCTVIDVLTGFKYIGEQITLLENKGTEDSFVFGFEESYGYLSGTHVRDKDAVVASMLICEMAAYYKAQGKTLFDVLDELYLEHGFYTHELINAVFEGAQGMQTMNNLMENLRENKPTEIAGLSITSFSDYLRSLTVDFVNNTKTPITLPKSNVLAFVLEGGASVVVRPSGTEPKIKAYITATGPNAQEASEMARRLTNATKKLLKV